MGLYAVKLTTSAVSFEFPKLQRTHFIPFLFLPGKEGEKDQASGRMGYYTLLLSKPQVGFLCIELKLSLSACKLHPHVSEVVYQDS